MSRKDALLRLHRSLMMKRNALRRQLVSELDQTHSHDSGAGDVIDVAADGSQNEIHSQLAAFESRELDQIERAIELIRKGRYGSCEYCGGRIPVARLKALPFTTSCIGCQQRSETRRFNFEDDGDWEKIRDFEPEDREISLGDIEIDAGS